MLRGIHRPTSTPNLASHFIDSARGDWSQGHPRVYKESLDNEEHNALLYILENLAKKSLLKLMLIQGKLKESGARLEHLHPLAFFMGIMNHSSLKNHFYKLRDKDNYAWKEFTQGAINSFKEEKSGANINDHHIEHFCQEVGKDPHFVRHLMHNENWNEFISHL
ncbi:MAG: hypothetical protein S4CHLAM7_12170 [Chlamydiae bacterium]|nr:hypothetical protein [Chlamydiota bacterium]